MLKWFRRLFEYINVRPTAITHNPTTQTVQEDPKVHEAVKRTRKAFKQQEQAMNARALKPHSTTCKDPLTCMKTKCFKWTPDKIMTEPYEVNRKEERREQRIRAAKKIIND